MPMSTSQASAKRIIEDLLEKKQTRQALSACDKALRIWPNWQGLQRLQLIVLKDVQEWHTLQRAAEIFISSYPENPTGWLMLGRSLLEQEQFEQATQATQQAIDIDQTTHTGWMLLGQIFRAERKFRFALSSYRKAYALAPSNAELLTTFGCLHLDLGNYVRAVQLQSKAHHLAPNNVSILCNLGNALRAQGALQKAIEVYREALARNQDLPGLEWNLAFTLLLSGDYVQGFQKIDGRFSQRNRPRLEWLSDSWNGDDLQGGRLLVETEQGFGDLLQFARFFDMAAQRNAQVILRCSPKMNRIMQCVEGLSHCVSDQEPPPEHEARIALMSLPRVMHCSSPSISKPSYLKAPSENIERWRSYFDPTVLNIGIAWQGNPEYEADHLRSVPLESYRPLLKDTDCRFFSLQKFHGLSQLHALPPEEAPVNLGRELDLQGHAFVDTAAVITKLDLVITSDTSIAHLAGALGVKTWVLLPFAPDWRWGIGSAQTPWYPNMRLFRQPKPRDWKSVISTITHKLQELKEQR